MSGGAASFERCANDSCVGVSAEVPTGAFHHLVASFDNTAIRIYVDGVQANARSHAASLPATLAPFLLGAAAIGDTTSIFQGILDEVAIYDKALPAARVQAHFAAAATR